ncbi:MAG: hypothetical protein KAS04_05425 [Candidatus Aenigmarchaeota archaeon]|nr:hypothetical protein [Candidatus Aenigmarchaeota archaeon]
MKKNNLTVFHVWENDYRKIEQQMRDLYSKSGKDYLNSLIGRLKKVRPEFSLPYLLLDSFGNFQITSLSDNGTTDVRGNIVNLEHEQNMRLDKLILNISEGKAPTYRGNVENVIELFPYELFPVTMGEVGKKYNINKIKIQ